MNKLEKIALAGIVVASTVLGAYSSIKKWDRQPSMTENVYGMSMPEMEGTVQNVIEHRGNGREFFIQAKDGKVYHIRTTDAHRWKGIFMKYGFAAAKFHGKHGGQCDEYPSFGGREVVDVIHVDLLERVKKNDDVPRLNETVAEFYARQDAKKTD